MHNKLQKKYLLESGVYQCLSKHIRGKHWLLRFQHGDTWAVYVLPPKPGRVYVLEVWSLFSSFLEVLSGMTLLVLRHPWLEFHDESCVMWGSVMALAGKKAWQISCPSFISFLAFSLSGISCFHHCHAQDILLDQSVPQCSPIQYSLAPMWRTCNWCSTVDSNSGCPPLRSLQGCSSPWSDQSLFPRKKRASPSKGNNPSPWSAAVSPWTATRHALSLYSGSWIWVITFSSKKT